MITAECHRFKQEIWQSHGVAFKEQFKNFVHADHDLFAWCARQHTTVNLDPNDLDQNHINSFMFLMFLDENLSRHRAAKTEILVEKINIFQSTNLRGERGGLRFSTLCTLVKMSTILAGP